ncbi:hypothetical protein FUA48_08715 [Flavobacterium alkalisoli]|uniref:Uncharacterized protein n=1 Tax=Flavobacterium alkalisoli TaxID=2602769 RepID=A0A5B9FQR3_9FLAO|nr:hypothetical protein [Flavobacterium alkalisoli]QEE49663.1 hypothetical protein FUA48_08715 [Flavobacterium alkalisoli]
MAGKCEKCGVSVFDRPLQRINEPGVNGIFWCEPCIKENEPELYNNLMEDVTPVEKELKDIFYNGNS